MVLVHQQDAVDISRFCRVQLIAQVFDLIWDQRFDDALHLYGILLLGAVAIGICG